MKLCRSYGQITVVEINKLKRLIILLVTVETEPAYSDNNELNTEMKHPVMVTFWIVKVRHMFFKPKDPFLF